MNTLEKEIDELYDTQARKLFDGIIENKHSIFNPGEPLYKYRDTDFLEMMIAYFQEIEEYEKCAELHKIDIKLKANSLW